MALATVLCLLAWCLVSCPLSKGSISFACKCCKRCPSCPSCPTTPKPTTESSTTGPTTSSTKGCTILSTSPSSWHTTAEASSVPSRTDALKSPIKVTSPEGIVGAAVGGAFLGSVVTAVVFICLRKRTPPQEKREEISQGFHNTVYQTESGSAGVQNHGNRKSVVYSEINDDTRKFMTVKPFRRQQNDPEPAATDDGVYNHLNESATVDNSDYYDHAKTGPLPSTPNDGYGVVTFTDGEEHGYPEEVNVMFAGIDRQIPAGEPVNDEYYMLEKIDTI